jgi:hypothetical protein
MVWGNVRATFAPFARNGATALFVRAIAEAEVDAAIDTIKQCTPVRIRVTLATIPVARL